MYEEKDLQRLYDEKYFATRRRPPMWKRRAEFIVEKFNPKIVLDIGCSWGELVKSLNDLNVSAFGIDGSDFAISHVDSTIKNKVFKVNLNSDPFPFDDQTFDLITGFYVIEHVHNMQFFANELDRTLKKDGKIYRNQFRLDFETSLTLSCRVFLPSHSLISGVTKQSMGWANKFWRSAIPKAINSIGLAAKTWPLR